MSEQSSSTALSFELRYHPTADRGVSCTQPEMWRRHLQLMPAANKLLCRKKVHIFRTQLDESPISAQEWPLIQNKHKMMYLQALPTELFDLIIEHLVVTIGIYKAALLRTVNRAFDAAISHAICVTQVVDINDPATPTLAHRMDPVMRGKIIATKARTSAVASNGYISVVAAVNQAMDRLIDETNTKLTRERHDAIAAAVHLSCVPIDANVAAQNLLSGAAIVGDLSLLKLLLGQEHVDINGTTPYFDTPLALAAARGDLAKVRYLLDCGAHLESVSKQWRHIHGLECQADWNRCDENVWGLALSESHPSALCSAVLGSHADIVHLLLRPEHRLPIDSLEYLRALVSGAKAGQLGIIKELFKTIEHDLSDFHGLGNEMLWAATRFDRKIVVQWLIDKGVDINACPYCARNRYHSALEIGASSGNISMVRFPLGRGADFNVNQWNNRGHLPIEGAARSGQDEVVDLLIDHGADPSKALQSGAEGGQIRLMKRLLSRLPDLPNRKWGKVGKMALFRACACRNLTAITVLVEAGVSIDDGLEPLCAPLNLAKQYGLMWMYNHLISLGAHETPVMFDTRELSVTARGICVEERTWEWVGKY